MTDYKELDIKELISLAKARDDEAFKHILELYKPMLMKVASGFVSEKLNIDEIYSEAAIALHRACMSYDLTKSDVTFGLYARICVYRRVYDLSAKMSRGPKLVPFDEHEVVFDDGLEMRLEGRERFEEHLKRAKKILSGYEYEVFLCYINGDTTQQICEKLSRDVKSVENAKSRMLKRLREESVIFSDS